MWVRMQADYGLSLAHPEGLPKTIQERALADEIKTYIQARIATWG